MLQHECLRIMLPNRDWEKMMTHDTTTQQCQIPIRQTQIPIS